MIRTNRTIKRCAGPRTPSELRFEEYLGKQGVTFHFEPPIDGKQKRPDYKLEWNNETLFCEVKELHENRSRPRGAITFDPYSSIRKKINEARKKFKEYREYCCVLVIQNVDDWEFRGDPYVLLGAMLGNYGLRFPFDPNKGVVLPDEGEAAFLAGGKMVDPKRGRTQNTTISAIAVLDEFTIPNLEFEKEYEGRVAKLRNQKTNGPTIDQQLAIRMEMYEHASPTLGRCSRVSVFENPSARKKLPKKVFQGAYDARHRFNRKLGRIERVFAGPGLKDAEHGLHKSRDILQQIEQFKQAVIERFSPERIVLFGSHAYGCPEPGSDVDLLVVFPGTGSAAHRSLEIRKKLAPDFPLDLLTRSACEIQRRLDLSDFFMREIIDNGKVLYEA